jgi:hypothetical protein
MQLKFQVVHQSVLFDSKFGSELLMMMREHENRYQKFACP